LQAFAAVEQEPGERVDGDAAREYFAHDLAVAFRLAVAEVALALRLLALSFFLLAPPFLGCLHLRGIIGGSAYHETSPFRSRAKPARSASEWSGWFCEWPKKDFVAIHMLPWLARGSAGACLAGILRDCLAGALSRVALKNASFDLRSVAKRVIEMRA
jgi:hypothetical protein